jgi:hypothetical protein
VLRAEKTGRANVAKVAAIGIKVNLLKYQRLFGGKKMDIAKFLAHPNEYCTQNSTASMRPQKEIISFPFSKHS